MAVYSKMTNTIANKLKPIRTLNVGLWVSKGVTFSLTWTKKHTAAIVALLLLQVVAYVVRFLPYFNWFLEPTFVAVLFVDLLLLISVLRFNFKKTIALAICLYITASVVYLLGLSKISELLGILVYGMLIVGLLQMLVAQKEV